MINISGIVAKTEAMFDLFNAHFYNSEMTRPAITVSPDGGRGAYGWCSIYEIWQGDGEAHREINITAEYINRPIAEVAATMLHEMAHLYNLTHGIKDVSNNGYYHNKKFKETAEAHGLHIEHHNTYGWTVTTLAEDTADWLAQQPGMDDFTASRKTTFQTRRRPMMRMVTKPSPSPKEAAAPARIAASSMFVTNAAASSAPRRK